jgi:hypothetical protein
MMVLQNHTNSEKQEWDPCSETYAASGNASQAISIKVEEVSDAEEEEGPVPITFLKIKADPEVRCMPLIVHGKVDLKRSKNVSCLSTHECL